MSMDKPRIALTHSVDGSVLFNDMGSFWTRLHESPTFVQRLQNAKALSSAQAQLSMNEVAAARNRHEIPVSRRVRWLSAEVRLSERNTGKASLLKFSEDSLTVFGPQTSLTHPPGAMFKFGGHANYAGIHTYPLKASSGGSLNIQSCEMLVDAVAAPTIVLAPGVDFILHEDTLIIRADKDPFNSESFYTHTCDDGDKALTVWLCDAYRAAEWVPQLSYLLGSQVVSTEAGLACINAVWDLLSLGATTVTVARMLCAIYGVPVARSGVIGVITKDGDTTVIVTDNGVYRVPHGYALLPGIVPGAALRDNDPLCDGIAFFSPNTPTSTLRDAVPAITFSGVYFASPVKYGLCATWDSVPIIYAGNDKNGSPRYRFDFVGTAEDNDAFWRGVWTRCEHAGVSMRTMLERWLEPRFDVSAPGDVCGYVSTLAFMLNIVGGATAIATVDMSQLPADVTLSGLPGMQGIHRLLRETIPAYARLYTVVRDIVASPGYSLDTEQDNVYDHSVCLSVWLPVKSKAKVVTGAVSTGGVKKGLQYMDAGVRIKWVPACTL